MNIPFLMNSILNLKMNNVNPEILYSCGLHAKDFLTQKSYSMLTLDQAYSMLLVLVQKLD